MDVEDTSPKRLLRWIEQWATTLTRQSYARDRHIRHIVFVLRLVLPRATLWCKRLYFVIGTSAWGDRRGNQLFSDGHSWIRTDSGDVLCFAWCSALHSPCAANRVTEVKMILYRSLFVSLPWSSWSHVGCSQIVAFQPSPTIFNRRCTVTLLKHLKAEVGIHPRWAHAWAIEIGKGDNWR